MTAPLTCARDPMMNNVPDLQRSELRRMQRIATGLLLVAAACYALAHAFEARYPGLGFLRAFCEAAMVGGLADWFAVTSLFRHPLGVPLPHTAIIPANKDRIGASLGRFVERNFLASDIVRGRLARTAFTATAADWLRDPARTAPVARQAVRVLPRLLEAIDDAPLRQFLVRNLHDTLARVDVAPLLAGVLELIATPDRLQALVDGLVGQARQFLADAEPDIRVRVRERTAWLWQKLGIDQAISDRLITVAQETLAEVAADPKHAWRLRLDALLREHAAALRHSPAYQARAEAFKQSLLAQPELADALGNVWTRLRERLDAHAAADPSPLAARLQDLLAGLGESLAGEPPVQRALDTWLRRALLGLVEARRHEAGELIAETVRRWDTGTVTERIERAIGRDLQYIRINGTVIGGLVGVGIHALSRWLG